MMHQKGDELGSYTHICGVARHPLRDWATWKKDQQRIMLSPCRGQPHFKLIVFLGENPALRSNKIPVSSLKKDSDPIHWSGDMQKCP